MKHNPYNRNNKSNCDVCGNVIYVDSVGNGGKCSNCSWVKCRDSEEYPDRVMCPNLIPLNKAKILYSDDKPFLPDFDDFLSGLCFYGEMEFSYNGDIYGVTRGSDEDGVEMWIENGDTIGTYNSTESFYNNAKIENRYLKDIWKDVKNANWLQ